LGIQLFHLNFQAIFHYLGVLIVLKKLSM